MDLAVQRRHQEVLGGLVLAAGWREVNSMNDFVFRQLQAEHRVERSAFLAYYLNVLIVGLHLLLLLRGVLPQVVVKDLAQSGLLLVQGLADEERLLNLLASLVFEMMNEIEYFDGALFEAHGYIANDRSARARASTGRKLLLGLKL